MSSSTSRSKLEKPLKPPDRQNSLPTRGYATNDWPRSASNNTLDPGNLVCGRDRPLLEIDSYKAIIKAAPGYPLGCIGLAVAYYDSGEYKRCAVVIRMVVNERAASNKQKAASGLKMELPGNCVREKQLYDPEEHASKFQKYIAKNCDFNVTLSDLEAYNANKVQHYLRFDPFDTVQNFDTNAVKPSGLYYQMESFFMIAADSMDLLDQKLSLSSS
ncbi:hypothetical protein B0O99DRAFT_686399 [Bisporella sp. PMI_857]|nr:hypothetical protein B0O99DRAFT_686399 [Bisporella sp. PMI_857]